MSGRGRWGEEGPGTAPRSEVHRPGTWQRQTQSVLFRGFLSWRFLGPSDQARPCADPKGCGGPALASDMGPLPASILTPLHVTPRRPAPSRGCPRPARGLTGAQPPGTRHPVLDEPTSQPRFVALEPEAALTPLGPLKTNRSPETRQDALAQAVQTAERITGPVF